MDEIKQGYRDVENKAREVVRESDGDESLADKAGNVADDVRDGLGNLGDDVREGIDELGDRVRDGVEDAVDAGREVTDRP
jgi:hypothetical protein